MPPTHRLYRFSPIQTEDTLLQAINHTVDSAAKLLQNYIGGTNPIESVTIFSHYPEEYAYLSTLVNSWGKSINHGYVELAKPLTFNQLTVKVLRVRQPDPYRSQVGCADFKLDFKSALAIMPNYPNQIKLIDRPTLSLLEFHHPDYDVLAYVARHQEEANTLATHKEVMLYGDGGSRGNPGPSASGFVIMDMNGHILFEAGVYLGITTNNQAEYQALKLGLEQAKKMGAREVHAHMDSLLVINQMKGIFKVKNRDLWPIHEAIKLLVQDFQRVTFTHVPRELNKLADSEVNKCLDAQTV